MTTARREPLQYDEVVEVERTGITIPQERLMLKRKFMADDMACYDSHILKKANALQRLRAKHAIKYGSKDGAQADAAATAT